MGMSECCSKSADIKRRFYMLQTEFDYNSHHFSCMQFVMLLKFLFIALTLLVGSPEWHRVHTSFSLIIPKCFPRANRGEKL